MTSTWQYVRCDYRRYYAEAAPGLTRVCIASIRHLGFLAVLLHRLSNERRVPRVTRLALSWLQASICGSAISPRSDLGPGLLFPHPHGITIGQQVVVGRECTIQQNVTLGANFGRADGGRVQPVIGDRVHICAGAVVAGPISIGDDCIIGANCVVTESLEAATVVKASTPTVARRR